MKLPWRTARNLNRIGGSMKRAQEICRGRKRVNESRFSDIGTIMELKEPN